ncbi:hypothetical protein VTO42DRAFT_4857 [Malbranchea cinnamomea]
MPPGELAPASSPIESIPVQRRRRILESYPNLRIQPDQQISQKEASGPTGGERPFTCGCTKKKRKKKKKRAT